LFDEADLLSGRALDLQMPEIPVAVPTSHDVVALDADMDAFIEPLKRLRDPQQKLLALIEALEDRGMFSLEYAEVTRSARGTFQDRQGNCLSFTMLFVTLARAAGLHASYQSVDVPPYWSYDGQVVVARHVNSVVRTGYGEDMTVDFNLVPYEGKQRGRLVDDSYALGLFYTNLGAEAIVRGEHAAALAYLREAAGANPDFAGVWVNLGVLYSRHGRYDRAEAAYLRALELDDEEPSALTNLTLVYEALGEIDLAAEYRARAQEYRERNPYYHFAGASLAFEQQRYQESLAMLRKAIRLAPDEHEFYELRGQVQTALGAARDAYKSFERAREQLAAEELRAQTRVELGGFALQ
jgi:tetratricopeptide (TPR) repeat protein